MDIGLDLPPECPLTLRLVQVVHHDDARRWNGLDVVPPGEGAGPFALGGGVFRPDDGRNRVPHDGAQVGKQRPDVSGQVAGLARPDLEGFNGIRDGGAGQGAQNGDLGG